MTDRPPDPPACSRCGKYWNSRRDPCRCPPKPLERILCASIEVEEGDGKIEHYEGHRHHDIFPKLARLYGAEWGEIRMRGGYTQGFLTSTGRFVDRAEAMGIALRASQVQKGRTHKAEELFSEDLY